ncbi:MAG: hypothetical protein IJJ84_03090 [Kiritimatiellae bacterium]|nr:hypothetical protein [Kiritimatiellia bacterium]
MTYALRKLIAFVFLGGMFWFIYQDLDNLDQPWFMHALGLITIVFAFFWLLIPMVVVWCRIRRRRAQNKERYQKWLAGGGLAMIRPRPVKSARLVAIDSGEQVFFHEKGTLYARLGMSGSEVGARPVGRPSDVAFPNYRHDCHVCQRTHCYFTNRRIAFEGKGLNMDIPFADLVKCSMMPGGMVFEVASGMQCAFTFQNPLVAADVLRWAKDGKKE